MSYDLTLYRTVDGVSVEAVEESRELRGEVEAPDPGLLRPLSKAEVAALHDALLACEPSLEDCGSDELVGGDDLPVTIGLMGDGFGFQLAYWHEGAAAARAAARVGRLLAVCREHGLRIYDPQVGREIVDPEAELEGMAGQYSEGTRLARGAATRPWWKFW